MKPRILIVDDEERMASVVAIALGRAGWECETCADGNEAQPTRATAHAKPTKECMAAETPAARKYSEKTSGANPPQGPRRSDVPRP